MESLPVAAVLCIDLLLLGSVLFGRRPNQNRGGSALVAALFFCSGFPALIYQIVWQRALFAIYGVNVQSVAVVVSAFMLGLGIGSLVGGWFSQKFPEHGIVIFGSCELAVAAFGLLSLRLFHWAAEATAGASVGYTILFSFLLLILPTMLMGATLPLLVEQRVRSSRDVGYSVATLYFVNTLGSAFACFLCAQMLMRSFGQSGSVTLAACLNTVVGATAFLCGRSNPLGVRPSRETAPGKAPARETFFACGRPLRLPLWRGFWLWASRSPGSGFSPWRLSTALRHSLFCWRPIWQGSRRARSSARP